MIITIPNFVIHITKDWIDTLSAFLAPLIAMITVYIAYQQWRTAEAQRRQDLFELRYKYLYQEIRDILYKMMDLNLKNQNDKANFISLVIDSWKIFENYGFLLKKKDSDTLEKLVEKWKNIVRNFNNNGLSDDEIYNYEKELHSCFNNIKELLESYLRIEQDDKNLWELLPSAMEKLLLFLIPKTIIRRLYKKL